MSAVLDGIPSIHTITPRSCDDKTGKSGRISHTSVGVNILAPVSREIGTGVVFKSPGSVGSSCSEDTPGDTRSLTEEENMYEVADSGSNRAINQSRNTAEAAEQTALPDQGASESELDAEPSDIDGKDIDGDDPLKSNPLAESKDMHSSPVRHGSPPKFYRLNASVQEHDDGTTNDERNNDSNSEDGTDQEIEVPMIISDHTFQNDITLVNPEKFCSNSHRGDETPVNTSYSTRSLKRQKSKQRGVRFSNVCIRDYAITIGDSPFCSHGVPICLDWDHEEEQIIPIDLFEASHRRKRTARKMLLNSFQRRDMLWRSGYALADIEKAIKHNEREKLRRSITQYFLPIFQIQEVLYFGAERCFGDITDPRQLEATVKKQQMAELQQKQCNSDTEMGGISVVHDIGHLEAPHRRLSFRGGSGSGASLNGSIQVDFSVRSGMSEMSHDRDDPYAASSNSRFQVYSVRVDRGQHDKASEIILCNLQRPHMRAFHSAWFSFFIAFFMWFAVTPLLKEIQRSLGLSKSDIWLSSLCGTSGTIIMRILIGPACDKFGARLCMAFMLVTSAIPCALTGLVDSAKGLSIVRTFVGIAGGSFVACQYWTSQMFTREVAGTANALVAGWGNLGGGVTQIVMGSVLFPLSKLVFSYEDSDDPSDRTNSAELAWRTIFVVPAVVSLLTAYAIVYHADDSPKGDYRERVRQQEIMLVSPTASLCAAVQNWNVWVLLIQYACCFGVEVTMTNATALYFQDEFGQNTVSSAAIASTFGFMNLFARGLGGFGSDIFNAKYGVRGRLAWQFFTLLVEGIAIVIFGFADKLGGSILALIFLSMMVQSAEGSTFGIVPYVDRRFTGSVVGWVGAGGNIGGVCFSVFFINFDYKKAFTLMGLAASASSLLSCFISCEKLSRDAEATGHEGKNSDCVQHNEAIGITRDTTITFAQLDLHQHQQDHQEHQHKQEP